jgi:hypothetical protein
MTGVRLGKPRRRNLTDYRGQRLPGRQVHCGDYVYNDRKATEDLKDYNPFGVSTWRWSMLENGEVWCRILSMNYADPTAPRPRRGGDPPVWLLKHKLDLEQRNCLIAGVKSPKDILEEVIKADWELSARTVLELAGSRGAASAERLVTPPEADVISNGCEPS